MRTIAQILDEVLARHGLGAPVAGRPLYQYRIQPHALADLRDAVDRRLKRSDTWTQSEAAGIALMAAETLCRDHQSGHWQWQTALGVDTERVQNDAVIDAMERYWHRPLMKSGRGRDLLRTLGREGGLPRHLLTTNGAPLAKVLRSALQARARLGATVTTTDLVSDYERYLPTSLRIPGVREILADIVDAIHGLRKKASGADDPIAHLDEQHPGWLHDLPLWFDDHQAELLVLDLVSTPIDLSFAEPFMFEIELYRGRLKRSLTLPNRVNSTDIARVFKGDGDLPTRSRLIIEADDGHTASAADIVLAAGAEPGHRYFRIREPKTTSLSLNRDLTLLLWTPRGVWRWCSPPGAKAPSHEEPWVFTDDERGCWLGAGSVRTRAASVRVVCPSDWRVTPAAEHVGEVQDGRHILRICAETALYPPNEDAAFRVRPSASEDDVHWHLQARMIHLAGRGTIALKDMPKVHERTASGVIRATRPVEYARFGDPGHWAPLDPTVFGDLWLRARDPEGAVHLRRRVLRVPEDFEVHLQPDTTRSNAGTVRVACERLATLTPVDLSPEVWQAPAPETLDFQFAEAPGPITLRVQLRHVRAFEITVPAPVVQLALLGLDRTPLDPNTPIAVDRLEGVRALAHDPRDRPVQILARTYRMSRDRGRKVATPKGRWMAIGALRPERGDVRGLALDELGAELRLLLADAGHLDGEVRLALEPVGGRRTAVLGRVRQYPRSLDIERADGSRRPTHLYLGAGNPDEVDLTIRPIGEPEHPGLKPPRDGESWRWPEAATVGGWLITGVEADLPEAISAVRPLFVWLGGAVRRPQADELLASAIAQPEPRRDPALLAAFDVLAEEPDRPDWALLDAHLDTLDVLPAATYDVVVALSKHPNALALAVLRRAADNTLDSVITAMETLPFAWWQIPLESWCAASGQLNASLAEHLDWVSATEFMFAGLARLLSESGLFVGIQRLVREWSGTATKLPALAEVLSAPLTELLRRDAEQQWPRLTNLRDLIDEVKMPEGILSVLPETINDHRRDVCCAPLIAAWVAHRGTPLDLHHLVAIRRLRAFDPDWFDTAWGHAIVRFHSDPAFTQDLPESNR